MSHVRTFNNLTKSYITLIQQSNNYCIIMVISEYSYNYVKLMNAEIMVHNSFTPNIADGYIIICM